MVVITEDILNVTEGDENLLATDRGKLLATGQQQTSGNHINKKAQLYLSTLRDT